MKLTRREVLKCAAASSAMVAINGSFPMLKDAMAAEPDKWVKSVCRFCGTGCGVMVGVKDGKVVTVKGDPNNLQV
jgi:nitrate reductase NapA